MYNVKGRPLSRNHNTKNVCRSLILWRWMFVQPSRWQSLSQHRARTHSHTYIHAERERCSTLNNIDIRVCIRGSCLQQQWMRSSTLLSWLSDDSTKGKGGTVWAFGYYMRWYLLSSSTPWYMIHSVPQHRGDTHSRFAYNIALSIDYSVCSPQYPLNLMLNVCWGLYHAISCSVDCLYVRCAVAVHIFIRVLFLMCGPAIISFFQWWLFQFCFCMSRHAWMTGNVMHLSDRWGQLC